jgi:hypothetical protein
MSPIPGGNSVHLDSASVKLFPQRPQLAVIPCGNEQHVVARYLLRIQVGEGVCQDWPESAGDNDPIYDRDRHRMSSAGDAPLPG